MLTSLGQVLKPAEEKEPHAILRNPKFLDSRTRWENEYRRKNYDLSWNAQHLDSSEMKCFY